MTIQLRAIPSPSSSVRSVIQCDTRLIDVAPSAELSKGWQPYVILLETGSSHITIFTKNNVSTEQFKAVNKTFKTKGKGPAVSSLKGSDSLLFDEFHVTIDKVKHHFYKDNGHVQLVPQKGKNEPLKSLSWLQANRIAHAFYRDFLSLDVSIGTLNSEAQVSDLTFIGSWHESSSETLEQSVKRFWGIKQ